MNRTLGSTWLYRIARILRPLMLRLPRGNVFLYCLCCDPIPPEFWRGIPGRFVVFRDRWLDAYVSVDLADRRGRSHFFLGRFQDVGNRLLIERWLRPGDVFIDIGASAGMHTLHASRVVGAAGRVISFEPHPDSFALLRAHLAINRITNCETHAVALGDREGEMQLAEMDDTLGTCTLREVSGALRRMTTRVARGDRLVSLRPDCGRILIKLDVEGFEHHVLRGLGGILDRDGVVLSIEVTDRWLRETGSSAVDLFRDLRERGYDGFLPNPRRRLLEFSLDLVPLAAPPPLPQYDAVFLRPRTLTSLLAKR